MRNHLNWLLTFFFFLIFFLFLRSLNFLSSNSFIFSDIIVPFAESEIKFDNGNFSLKRHSVHSVAFIQSSFFSFPFHFLCVWTCSWVSSLLFGRGEFIEISGFCLPVNWQKQKLKLFKKKHFGIFLSHWC